MSTATLSAVGFAPFSRAVVTIGSAGGKLAGHARVTCLVCDHHVPDAGKLPVFSRHIPAGWAPAHTSMSRACRESSAYRDLGASFKQRGSALAAEQRPVRAGG